MADPHTVSSAPVPPGEHIVVPPDMNLHNNALKAASASEIATLLANAEQALGALRSEFGQWLSIETGHLAQLLADYAADPTGGQRDMLYRALHDMRSNAPSFGNTLAGQIADHMCKLFDASGKVPLAIVEAHVHSIQAVVREEATTAEHPVGGVIIRELMRASAMVSAASE
jgi:hypothetical protein